MGLERRRAHTVPRSQPEVRELRSQRPYVRAQRVLRVLLRVDTPRPLAHPNRQATAGQLRRTRRRAQAAQDALAACTVAWLHPVNVNINLYWRAAVRPSLRG